MGAYVNFNELIDVDLFKSYLFYLGILVIKMMVMSPLTTRQRFKHMAFISEEDVKMLGGKVGHSNPDVERVRRAHLNDLESIPMFLLVAFGYICTGPSVWLATLLLRIFTICRILHTIVYAVIVTPQPARGICWAIGYTITGYMAVATIYAGLA